MRHSCSSPNRSMLLSTALVALTTVSTLAGCAPDKGPGSLTVTYVIGNHKTCAEVGVDDVRAELVEGPTSDPTVLHSDILPCESEGEIVLSELEPRTYALVVTAYDNNGVAIFDNLGQEDNERRIEIFEAAQADMEAELTARPAELELRWRLGPDGFGNCDGVGIDRFEIKSYQVGGGVVLLETQLDCELEGDGQGFRLVPDPDRSLNGVLFGEVGIQGLDSAGEEVGDAAIIAFDPVGPGYGLQLTIECTEMGCFEEQP